MTRFSFAWLLIAALSAALLLAAPAVAQERTDQDILQAVRTALLRDAVIPANVLEVTVNNGAVALMGTVGSTLVRSRAEDVAATVHGVQSVINNIEVTPQAPQRDDEIRAVVEAALLWDPATSAYGVDVSVADGIVTLAGTVETLAEKRLVEDVAQSVAGVRAVVNDVDVAQEVEVSDEDLEAAVREALRWKASVEARAIDVAVEDGEVTLSGTVRSAAEKRLAVQTVWLPGVDVVNAEALTVGPLENLAPEAADAELEERKQAAIAAAVERTFTQNPRLDTFNIDVTVENGVATLTGVVDNAKARRLATQLARDVVGVHAVENKLSVEDGGTDAAQEDIAQRIERMLEKNPYLTQFDFQVRYEEGTAYLEGLVSTHFQRAEADDIASRTRGVLRVVNDIEVDEGAAPYDYSPYVDNWYIRDYEWYSPEAGAAPSEGEAVEDDRLLAEVQDQFYWSPFIDTEDIDVEVAHGRVTLTGEVDSWAEHQAAQKNAFDAGAQYVVNKLRIR